MGAHRSFLPLGLLLLGYGCGGSGQTRGDDAGCPGPAFDGGPLDPGLVAQGSALVSQYQCQQCHGTTMSGNDDGVPIPNSSLTQYPPNLTSDPATGLGCWTDAQIVNAILNSVDNQGQPICGPMPHFSALGLSQANAAAVVAYLRSLTVFQNSPPSGPSCACEKDADCPPAESCLPGGSCSCETLPCAIPAAGLGDGGADQDGGVLDGGSRQDGGRRGPDADLDGGRPDGGADAGPADAGAGDAGRPDAGSPDAGQSDAGDARGDAGDRDAGQSADAG